jgi:DNA mismatch endonuclease (patch repair protein)
MSRIRSTDTKPELLLRRELWRQGARGWRCQWRGPEGRIDVAFTRWKVAVFVDGCFWHGHPSKWQPNRWTGYWDEKIKRNIARDVRQNAALAAAGWEVIRLWDFEIEQDSKDAAQRVIALLQT